MRNATTLAAVCYFCICAISACSFHPTSYVVRQIRIGLDGQVQPIGTPLLVDPPSGSYYRFFHGANLVSVNHFERKDVSANTRRLLYLETKLDGKLDRTVKSDELLIGDFGTVSARRTCFYNRPLTSNFSSVMVSLDPNGYPQAFEVPSAVSSAPEPLPPLTSVSIVRVIHDNDGYVVVSADYEANGRRRNLQTFKRKNSQNEILYKTAPADPLLEAFSIPQSADMTLYATAHRLELQDAANTESTSLIQFYGFGKLIELQELRKGVPVSTRWLKPTITSEEEVIGPECEGDFGSSFRWVFPPPDTSTEYPLTPPTPLSAGTAFLPRVSQCRPVPLVRRRL
jgi:hypothetical protein